MNCKLLTHPSISTHTSTINLALTRPSRSSAIPPITIYSVAVITWVFAVFLCSTALMFWPKAFPALFLILFRGNWGVENASTSCAGLLVDNEIVICNGPATILGWLNWLPCSNVMVQIHIHMIKLWGTFKNSGGNN